MPSALASELQHGNGALQLFDEEGFANSPAWVQYWIMFMGLSFVCGLLFVWNHPLARWVVGCFVAGLICLEISTSLLGIVPLSGFIACIHLIFWSPALYLLIKQRPIAESRTAFALWSAVITFVIAFSFVFDIRDAFIYLQHSFAG